MTRDECLAEFRRHTMTVATPDMQAEFVSTWWDRWAQRIADGECPADFADHVLTFTMDEVASFCPVGEGGITR